MLSVQSYLPEVCSNLKELCENFYMKKRQSCESLIDLERHRILVDFLILTDCKTTFVKYSP